jgi:hypothetical protein
MASLTIESVIKSGTEIHGGVYTYTQLTRVKGRAFVGVVCKVHGERVMSVSNHISAKSGCNECANVLNGASKRRSLESYIEQANKIHKSKYKYLGVDYADGRARLEVSCSEHGIFYIGAKSHIIQKSGCPSCWNSIKRFANIKVPEYYEFRGNSIHMGKYSYNGVCMVGYKKHLNIICKTHGEFTQDVSSHISKAAGCPRCANSGHGSYKTDALMEFIVTLGVAVEDEVRLTSSRHRWDIVCRNEMIAVEFDGVYWHSTKFDMNKAKMTDKASMATKSGFRQINIWETEWDNNPDMVKRIVSSALGVSLEAKVGARSCTVSEISHEVASRFLEVNHLQGSTRSGKHLALTHESVLVAVLTVESRSKGRNGSASDKHLHVTRYATSCRVRGGFQKLLKAALQKHPLVELVYSFSDNRLFTGNMYKSAGFSAVANLPPDYQYVSGQGRVRSKRACQKSWFEAQSKTSKILFDPSLTERELAALNGLYQLYDRGKVRWELVIS